METPEGYNPELHELRNVKGIYKIFKKRRLRHTKPTLRQIKALQYISQGMKVMPAMKKAGYSRWTAKRSTDIFKLKGVREALSSMRAYIEDEGIDKKRLAGKLNEFLEAEKIHSSHTEPDKKIPDYVTQRWAWDRADRIVSPQEANQGNIKRKLTIEEFIGDE